MPAAARPRAWRVRGFTLSPIYLIYVVVAVLTILIGWEVLAGFAVLMALFWAFAYFDDRRHQVSGSDLGSTPPPPEAPHAEGHELDGHCPECGAELFRVQRNVTTQAEIIAFARSAKGWRENLEALAGWMPTGIYCPDGCQAIHTTAVPEFGSGPTAPAPEDGVPAPVRIRYADVLRDGGSYELAYESSGHETIKVLLRVVKAGGVKRTGYQEPRLISVDPVTYEEISSREIDWDAAERLASLLRPLVTSGGEIELGGASRASEMIRYLSLRGGL